MTTFLCKQIILTKHHVDGVQVNSNELHDSRETSLSLYCNQCHTTLQHEALRGTNHLTCFPTSNQSEHVKSTPYSLINLVTFNVVPWSLISEDSLTSPHSEQCSQTLMRDHAYMPYLADQYHHSHATWMGLDGRLLLYAYWYMCPMYDAWELNQTKGWKGIWAHLLNIALKAIIKTLILRIPHLNPGRGKKQGGSGVRQFWRFNTCLQMTSVLKVAVNAHHNVRLLFPGIREVGPKATGKICSKSFNRTQLHGSHR